MKKFIGNVNGVEYNNREDFNEAVKEAMKNPCDTLVITSYEKIIPDEEVKPKSIVSADDFVIELESDKDVTADGVEYRIYDGLKEKLQNCDNKEEVRRHINRKLKEWNNCYDDNERNISNYEDEIRVANRNIEECKEQKANLEAGIRYYKTLLGYVGDGEEEPVVEKKPVVSLEDKKRQVQNVQRMGKEFFDELANSFGSYLKKKGFFDFE